MAVCHDNTTTWKRMKDAEKSLAISKYGINYSEEKFFYIHPYLSSLINTQLLLSLTVAVNYYYSKRQVPKTTLYKSFFDKI